MPLTLSSPPARPSSTLRLRRRPRLRLPRRRQTLHWPHVRLLVNPALPIPLPIILENKPNTPLLLTVPVSNQSPSQTLLRSRAGLIGTWVWESGSWIRALRSWGLVDTLSERDDGLVVVQGWSRRSAWRVGWDWEFLRHKGRTREVLSNWFWALL